ncbi:MAG: M67 family metallopeptidase [Actinomycetota bacterium]|nr:M67 family metallopeptidase [Actinomycetota bacterium]
MTRPAVRLSEDLRQKIIDHCLAELPNEGCGLLAMEGDRVVEVYPTENLDRSPVGYTIPPEEHFAALTDAESHGWSLGGVFHSHPNGQARPSMTDVRAALEPDWAYLIVGLGDDPVVRAWSIREGQIEAVGLV